MFSRTLAERSYGPRHTVEFDRIYKLPRRSLDLSKVQDLTSRFAIPGSSMKLWPIQSAALAEIERCKGGFFPIGVGHGKTIIALLAGEILGAARPVLLVPPALREQIGHVDIPRLSQCFNFRRPNIVSYSALSSSGQAGILDQYQPDLIVCDEAHSLKRKESARTKRLLRYFKAHPETKFVALSGTMTTRSIKDFAHLIALALREGAPVPFTHHDLNDWAEALDVSPYPAPAGVLTKLCQEPNHDHVEPRSSFRCRLVCTSGVVATAEGALGTSLVITGLYPNTPEPVVQALKKLRETWCRPDGEELTEAIEFHRVAKQLALGFYYKWEWPNGVDHEWLEARSAWHREIRNYLTHRSRQGCDSPLLYANAVRAGTIESAAWAGWDRVRSRPEPKTVPVWVSDDLVQECVRWAKARRKKKGNGIIWAKHDAFGKAVAQALKAPYFGGGNEASKTLAAITANDAAIIVCSVQAHGTGKNLQSWDANLLTTPIGGGAFEQLAARTHRPGQLADCVTVDVFMHTAEVVESWRKSVEEALYIEQTQGQKMKVNYSTKVG